MLPCSSGAINPIFPKTIYNNGTTVYYLKSIITIRVDVGVFKNVCCNPKFRSEYGFIVGDINKRISDCSKGRQIYICGKSISIGLALDCPTSKIC